MGIAALAYVFLMVCSLGLPAQSSLSSMTEAAKHEMLLTPWVMVGMYFILTLAELFISPLGLSFVSKVAPPHLQGVMQGALARSYGSWELAPLHRWYPLYERASLGLLAGLRGRLRCLDDHDARYGQVARNA